MPDDVKSQVGPDDKTIVRDTPMEDEVTPSKTKGSKPPYIVVVDGPHIGTRFPLVEGAHIIGRAVGVSVRLDDQSVSRQHAELARQQTGWLVKDLGSKNGTFVNGQPVVDPVVVGHKDLIKVGIYLLRLITQETTVSDEMTLPEEYVVADRTMLVSSQPEASTGSIREELPEEPAEISPAPQHKPRTRPWMVIGGGVVVAVLAMTFVGLRFYQRHQQNIADEIEEVAPIEETLSEEESGIAPAEEASMEEGAASMPPAEEGAELPPMPITLPQGIPVFLDFVSSPMPVDVMFQEKPLGRTPLRVNVELTPGQSYTAHGTFTMPEIHEEYTLQVPFTVEADKAVIPILFRGPVGMVRVDDLPRDVQFYLEGNFEYDRFKERQAKLSEIVLKKPIYIPYGRYIIELKRARKLSETSQTFVQDIIYRREFVLAEENPTSILMVTDKDLSVFPAEIRSAPTNADVFIDGLTVGKTPYKGVFPLGEHRLTLRKDGYFEHTEMLKVDINTPYATEVALKTSEAGDRLNRARAAIDRALYQEAINELADALTKQATASETAFAHYLLGQAYLRLGDLQRARGYFEQAKTDEGQKYKAILGLVNVDAIEGKVNAALPLLVDVLLNAKDETIKREANDLFQKISPFRSVVYVYSDPPGAIVIVNDKKIDQTTPVILHELPLGNYRLKIEKPGFLPTELNMTLSVNEFNPVIVKLRPTPR